MKHKVIEILCVIVLVFTTYGCSEKNNNTLIVGVSPDYPPFAFEYRNKLIGFDIDLVSAIAERLHYKVEFKKMGFDELLPALENKTVDLIASALTQTQERSQKFDFSRPYYNPTFAIVFKREKYKDLNNIKEINGRIGVEKGTTMSDYLEKIKDNSEIEKSIPNINNNQENIEDKSYNITKTSINKKYFLKVKSEDAARTSNTRSTATTDAKTEEIPLENIEQNKNNQSNELQIKLYPKHLDLLVGLEKDEVNAIFVEILQAEVITQNNRDMAYIPLSYNEDKKYYYGIVFPRGSKLTQKFNKILDDIDSEGKIDILRLRWFSGYGIYGDILKNN